MRGLGEYRGFRVRIGLDNGGKAQEALRPVEKPHTDVIE